MEDVLDKIDDILDTTPSGDATPNEAVVTEDEKPTAESVVESTPTEDVLENPTVFDTTVMGEEMKKLSALVSGIQQKVESYEADINNLKAEMTRLFFSPTADATVEKDEKFSIDELIEDGVIDAIL